MTTALCVRAQWRFLMADSMYRLKLTCLKARLDARTEKVHVVPAYRTEGKPRHCAGVRPAPIARDPRLEGKLKRLPLAMLLQLAQQAQPLSETRQFSWPLEPSPVTERERAATHELARRGRLS